MSKLFAIIFSTLIFFQSTNLLANEVLKVSELIDHAVLHQDRYGDDFFVFLSKHYGDLKESHRAQHQKEKEEQRKANHQENTIQTIVNYLPSTSNWMIRFRQFEDSRKLNNYYQDKFSSFEKQKLFRPPKHC